MIKEIHIGNFKAFGDTQIVPIKPITLIFGPNSSGKSSIIHSIALVKEAVETGDLDVRKPAVSGDSIDLGGFRQYVHRHNTGHDVEWSVVMDVNDLGLKRLFPQNNSLRISLFVAIDIMGAIDQFSGKGHMRLHPTLKAFAVQIDNSEIIRMVRTHKKGMKLEKIDLDNPTIKSFLKESLQGLPLSRTMGKQGYKIAGEAMAEIEKNMEFKIRSFFPEKLSGVKLSKAPKLVGKNIKDVQSSIINTMNEFIDKVVVSISECLSRFHYLSQVRSQIPRHIYFSEYSDSNWIAGGGFAWDIVIDNPTIREKVNLWLKTKLKTPYELRVRHWHAGDKKTSKKKDNFAGEVIEKKELCIFDLRAQTVVSPCDIGVGINRVIPLLVGAYSFRNKIIAIEEPEISMHPALQAEIGDVFIESALGENRNTYILETHSEHLILRILKRIRQTSNARLPKDFPSVKPSNVSVLYVEPDKAGSIVREMRLNEKGEFIEEWPSGFFPERLTEFMDEG